MELSGAANLTALAYRLTSRMRGIRDTNREGTDAFFGHSVGALVAFETTRQLRRAGRQLPELLALSAFPAPHQETIQAEVARWLAGGIDSFTTLIGAEAGHLRGDPDRLAAACTALLADGLLVLQYRHHAEPPLETPLALYGGESDPVAPPSRLAAWNDVVTLPTTPHLLPGGHQYPRQQTVALVDRLVTDLRAATRVL